MIRVIIEHQANNAEDAEKVIAVIHKIRDEIMKLPGYISGETLINTEDGCDIIVISTWESLEQWNEWKKREICRELEEQEAPFLAKPLSFRTCESHHVMWMHDTT